MFGFIKMFDKQKDNSFFNFRKEKQRKNKIFNIVFGVLGFTLLNIILYFMTRV